MWIRLCLACFASCGLCVLSTLARVITLALRTETARTTKTANPKSNVHRTVAIDVELGTKTPKLLNNVNSVLAA